MDEALANAGAARVLWVQLGTAEAGDQRVARLKQWVDAGDVLWLDTDLGKEFGFPPMRAPGTDRNGRSPAGRNIAGLATTPRHTVVVRHVAPRPHVCQHTHRKM